MKDALLDYIFDNCDAAYISDLRQKMIFQEYADMILEIEDTKFSVEEWNYVYRYLTGANAVFSAVAEVKEALRSWMQAWWKLRDRHAATRSFKSNRYTQKTSRNNKVKSSFVYLMQPLQGLFRMSIAYSFAWIFAQPRRQVAINSIKPACRCLFAW